MIDFHNKFVLAAMIGFAPLSTGLFFGFTKSESNAGAQHEITETVTLTKQLKSFLDTQPHRVKKLITVNSRQCGNKFSGAELPKYVHDFTYLVIFDQLISGKEPIDDKSQIKIISEMMTKLVDEPKPIQDATDSFFAKFGDKALLGGLVNCVLRNSVNSLQS